MVLLMLGRYYDSIDAWRDLSINARIGVATYKTILFMVGVSFSRMLKDGFLASLVNNVLKAKTYSFLLLFL